MIPPSSAQLLPEPVVTEAPLLPHGAVCTGRRRRRTIRKGNMYWGIRSTASLSFLLLQTSMQGLKHLLLVEVMLVHEISNLFVMMLKQLHRLVVDVLLQHRVLARVVDVVRVMMMNL